MTYRSVCVRCRREPEHPVTLRVKSRTNDQTITTIVYCPTCYATVKPR